MKPYYQDSAVTIWHGDCREILPTLEPVDLVCMDPPYGINENSKKVASRGKLAAATDYGGFSWDKNTVEWELLSAYIKLGKYCCCWGGNYYPVEPSASWLVWDKENSGDFADAELAWTNYGSAVRVKRHMWNGMIRKGHEIRFHPTQKPIEVITWAISLCPNNPQTILDPFAGSCTTGRAAKDLNKKAILIEREEKYCEVGANRMSQEVLAL